ncbi:MAG: DNA phosphorothioation-associated putative methyltransferase [Spirochaetales bacterium]|nr:DNA phosphorothioation-associated putative methyltransferase [Spirochaetales bacterium]
MNKKEFLLDYKLIKSTDTYIEFDDITHKTEGNFDFASMSIDSLDLRDQPEEVLKAAKKRWIQTKKLLLVYTTEIKSTGLNKILFNTLNTPAVPAAPGLFFFFKDRDLAEVFQFNIQCGGKEETKDDVLVYLALARIKNESVLSSMPRILKDKVTDHLGNNIRAIAESRKLLSVMGRPGMVKELCEKTEMGMQDDEALWIHTSLIRELDPALRVYIGCSSFFYGDPASADIVKIHKKSSKITYYLYDDFDNKLLPEMHDRIKVDLSRQKMDHFDHRSNNKPEVVYFKERFVSPYDSRYREWKNFSDHLVEKGYAPEGIHIEQNRNLREILNSFCA